MNCKYWTQEVEEVVFLIKELYKKEPAGGMLHVIVDDGNLEDEHLQWCIDYCNREENTNRHNKLMCLDIANRMLELTYEQRVLVYYMEMSFECKGDCKKCAVERAIEDDEELWQQDRMIEVRSMNNIADDISRAYHEGYEQGRFEGIMDATDGKAACKGYDIVAVVKCKNCEYKEKAKVNSKGFLICPTSGMEIKYDDYCSYGEPRKSLYKTE